MFFLHSSVRSLFSLILFSLKMFFNGTYDEGYDDDTDPTAWYCAIKNCSLAIMYLIGVIVHRGIYRTFSRLGPRHINIVVMPFLVRLYVSRCIRCSNQSLRIDHVRYHHTSISDGTHVQVLLLPNQGYHRRIFLPCDPHVRGVLDNVSTMSYVFRDFVSIHLSLS